MQMLRILITNYFKKSDISGYFQVFQINQFFPDREYENFILILSYFKCNF